METKLRSLWNQGKAGVNGWLSVPSTIMAEFTARQGFDSLVVDLQHGLNSPAYAKQMIALGFDTVTVGSDVRIYLSGVASTLAEMRSQSA